MSTLPPPRSWSAELLESVPACPVCGCKRRALLHHGLVDRLCDEEPGDWTLYRCKDCQSAWLDARPTVEAIAQAYRGDYYTHQSGVSDGIPWAATEGFIPKLKSALINGALNRRFGYSLSPAALGIHRALALIPGWRGRVGSLVRELPAPAGDSRLLDVGCGNGSFLRTMASLGWRTAGVEPDPEAAAFGQATGLEIVHGSLSADLFAPNSFDAITMGHVIEHFHDPVEALAVCRRLLRPGGRIWIATPNIDSAVHGALGRGWFALEPPRHLVIFCRRSLEQALAKAGFDRVASMLSFPSARQWMYQASLDIAEGAYREGHLRRPSGIDSFRALRCDIWSLVDRERSEELVMTARCPG